MSWGELPWGVRGKVRKEERPNRIFYGVSSRIELHNYDEMPTVDAVEKASSSQKATSQSFAPAWELLAMFVLAAAMMGWRFRRELFPYASREVVATQQATEGDILDMSDDEEDIEEQEEVSTSEDTEHIGDVVFNQTLHLINSGIDGEEGGGSVGDVEDDTAELEGVDLLQQSPTQYRFEGRELGFI